MWETVIVQSHMLRARDSLSNCRDRMSPNGTHFVDGLPKRHDASLRFFNGIDTLNRRLERIIHGSICIMHKYCRDKGVGTILPKTPRKSAGTR